MPVSLKLFTGNIKNGRCGIKLVKIARKNYQSKLSEQVVAIEYKNMYLSSICF